MASTITKTKLFGGSGGSTWDDDINNHSPPIVGVSSIAVRHGNQVDSLQVTYLLADGNTYAAPKHGGTGGTASSFTLAEDEKIFRVAGKTNNTLVDQLTFFTRNSLGDEMKYGPYGKTGETPFSVEGNVVGFYGRAGDLLDGLGIYYVPPTKKRVQLGEGDGQACSKDSPLPMPPHCAHVGKRRATSSLTDAPPAKRPAPSHNSSDS